MIWFSDTFLGLLIFGLSIRPQHSKFESFSRRTRAIDWWISFSAKQTWPKQEQDDIGMNWNILFSTFLFQSCFQLSCATHLWRHQFKFYHLKKCQVLAKLWIFSEKGCFLRKIGLYHKHEDNSLNFFAFPYQSIFLTIPIPHHPLGPQPQIFLDRGSCCRDI